MKLLFFFIVIDLEARGHINHTSQDTELLSLCNFPPNKIANVLPHPGMAAQALKGAALHRVVSRWQRSAEEREHRGMSLSHLF